MADRKVALSEAFFCDGQCLTIPYVRVCMYPQELVIELEQPSQISEIQLLSHQFKIATKIEIYVTVAEAGANPKSVDFKRLG